MKLGTLEKIESSHNNLRTNSMNGYFEEFPKVGEPFRILGKGLEFGTRIIHTTPITEILEEKEDLIVFKTLNSTYRVSLLSENSLLDIEENSETMGTQQ